MTDSLIEPVPRTMRAAVYRAPGAVELEDIPVPEIGDGEMLVRVKSCGVCGTDLKKIQYGLQPGPRVFGHETAGVVSKVARGVEDWKAGDRVALFHHVSCGDCFYCNRGLDSQCAEYQKTAITAGFIEPTNTCLKGIRRTGLAAGDTLLVFGLGPIGLLIALIARQQGMDVLGVDPAPDRRAGAERIAGISAVEQISGVTAMPTDGLSPDKQSAHRGADAAIVATPVPAAIVSAVAAVRPGGRVVLFASTRSPEIVGFDAGAVCTQDKEIVGSYSSSMDLIPEASRLVFQGAVPVAALISHRFPLSSVATAIRTSLRMPPGTLKVIVNP
ncbi:MAG: alcohol dehydrogenase catalytic domain-containing protein [Chloroflexi bacterium]|nr:alcohol dehydrogenase catalytic domain-containing protein [Chloroflexota bacterium]